MPDPLLELEQQARQYAKVKQYAEARSAFLSLFKQGYQAWSLPLYQLAINTCLRCQDRVHAALLLQQALVEYPDSMQLCLLKARELLTHKKLKANAVVLFGRVFMTEPDLLNVQDLIRFRELMYMASLAEEMAAAVHAQFLKKLADSRHDELTRQCYVFEFYWVANQLEAAQVLFETALRPHLDQLKKKYILLYIEILKASASYIALQLFLQNDIIALSEPLLSAEQWQSLVDEMSVLQGTLRSLLVDAPGYRIEYYQQQQTSDYLFVCFNGVMGHKKHRTFGLDFMLKQGFDVITVNSAMQGNYQLLSVPDFAALVRPLSQHKRHVYTYGHSLGAYMALYYAGAIDAQVIASAPRHPGHPRFYNTFDPALQQALTVPYQHDELVDVAKTSQPVFIFYDPFEKKDQFMLDELVLPAYPQARVCQLPRATHSTVMVLKELGLLKDFILSMVHQQRFLDVDLSQMQPNEKMLLIMLREVVDQQEYAEVVLLADQLLMLNPKHNEAYYHKADALIALQDISQATSVLQTALSHITPSSQGFYNQLRLLQEALTDAGAGSGEHMV